MRQNELVTFSDLPGAVVRYLDAHRVHDTAALLASFTGDATVIDDGSTYTGTEAIEKWMNRSAGEYTYTSEPVAVAKDAVAKDAVAKDAVTWTVTQHLEGDFPGGVVDLRFRFALRDGLIEHLVIEP